MVVVAGYERSNDMTGTPSVWAHQWALDDVIPPILDGVVIGNSAYGGYAQFGEVHTDHQATIGVMVHELGHTLNWPDLYDIDGSSYGVGDWSVMGTGNWNQTSLAGDSPAHPDAFLKWYQGWVTPTAVSLTMNNVGILQAEDNPVAYLLHLNPGGVNWELGSHSGTGEYFLVENRQQTLYDAGLPGCGLLFWHIDESVTSTTSANTNEDRPLVALVQADNANDLANHVNEGDGTDDGTDCCRVTIEENRQRLDKYGRPTVIAIIRPFRRRRKVEVDLGVLAQGVLQRIIKAEAFKARKAKRKQAA